MDTAWLIWSSSGSRLAKRSMSAVILRNASESVSDSFENVWNLLLLVCGMHVLVSCRNGVVSGIHEGCFPCNFWFFSNFSGNIGIIGRFVWGNIENVLHGLILVIHIHHLVLWIGQGGASSLRQRRHWIVGVYGNSPVWASMLCGDCFQAPSFQWQLMLSHHHFGKHYILFHFNWKKNWSELFFAHMWICFGIRWWSTWSRWTWGFGWVWLWRIFCIIWGKLSAWIFCWRCWISWYVILTLTVLVMEFSIRVPFGGSLVVCAVWWTVRALSPVCDYFRYRCLVQVVLITIILL